MKPLLTSLVLLLFLSSSSLGFKTIIPQEEGDFQHCETVLDEVWEEKCETVFRDNCIIKGVTKCETVLEKDCHEIVEQKCGWETEQKCLTHPVPFCKLEWEKVCTSKPNCVTHFDEVCAPVDKQVCYPVEEKECTTGIKKVCREVPVPGVEAPVPEYLHDKGEVGGGHHSRHKRSLEALLNKLDFKAKKLELKRQKLIKHYALKGHFLQGEPQVFVAAPPVSLVPVGPVGHPGSVHPVPEHPPYGYVPVQGHAEHQRQSHQHGHAHGHVAEGHGGHEKGHAGLEKGHGGHEKGHAGLEKGHGGHEEGHAELEKGHGGHEKGHVELEKGHAAPEKGHDKGNWLEAKDNFFKEKTNFILEKINMLTQKGAKAHPKDVAVLIEPKPEPVHVIPVPKFVTECREEPEEKCAIVPRQVCKVEVAEECKQVPREVCHDIESCTDVPRKNCGLSEKETCIPMPVKKCAPVKKPICKDVPRQLCRDVPHEYCDSVPGKDCKKILVKRPRQVCLPTKNRY